MTIGFHVKGLSSVPLVLYTTTEATEFLAHLTSRPPRPKTISKLCREGAIRAVKLGHEYLIMEEDLRQYLRDRRAPGRPPRTRLNSRL